MKRHADFPFARSQTRVYRHARKTIILPVGPQPLSEMQSSTINEKQNNTLGKKEKFIPLMFFHPTTS